MTTSPLPSRDELLRLVAALEDRDRAERAYQDALDAAIAADPSDMRVAAAAGVSRMWVWRLRNATKEGS